MKINFITIIFLIGISANCLVLNRNGVNDDRVPGYEAKERILIAAITSDIFYSSLYSIVEDPDTEVGVNTLSLFAGELSSIEDDEFYLKKDIDKCVSGISNYQSWILIAPYAPIIFCRNIKPADGKILGSPFPRI